MTGFILTWLIGGIFVAIFVHAATKKGKVW